MTKTITAILGLFLFFTSLSAVEGQTGSGEGFTYTINVSDTNTVTITSYTNLGGLVTIPSSINGLTVTAIGDSAFAQNGHLITLTIPSSVTSIGNDAFQVCLALASVTIPGSITNIGDEAFLNCPSLTNATMEFGLTTIGTGMFEECGWLRSATIPSSVSSIGDQAFFYCGSLTNIMIPASVTNLGLEAFADCPALAAIDVDTNSSAYASVDGVLFDKNLTQLLQCPAAFSGGYTVPGSVTAIGEGAFYNCPNLTSVMIPEGVTNIADDAFFYCESLTTVYFMGNAPVADSSVFTDDGNATVYYLSSAFGWSSPFAGLPAVPWVPGEFLFTTNAGTVIITGYTGGGGDVGIPSYINGIPVSGIGENAFSSSGITSVTIPGNLTSIGSGAFNGCSNLSSITIPANVTNIGASAFDGCTSLTSITLPSSITSIGETTFYDCANLTNVIIAASVTNIGNLAFVGCNRLSVVYFNGNAPKIGSSIFSSDDTTVYYSTGASGWKSTFAGRPAVEIPYNLIINADQSFTISGYRGLAQALSIPSTIAGRPVTSIGMYAFGESGLISVIIPTNVTSIGVAAFANCPILTTVTIPNGVTNIAQAAFADCSSLVSVIIPASVTEIGAVNEVGAFSECTGLTNVCFEGNAPLDVDNAFSGDNLSVLYYIEGSSGWASTFSGIPTETCSRCAEIPTGSGALLVTITPKAAITDGAQWQVDNGASNSSGTAVGLLAGIHTITFDSVSGWGSAKCANNFDHKRRDSENQCPLYGITRK